MKPLKWIALSLVLIPALVAVQGKPKKTDKLPAVFDQASYVYVEAVDGQPYDLNLLPEDRRAIADVENALGDWHRYALTIRREDADLVFVVRKGRLASAGVDVSGGNGPQINIGSNGRQQNNPGGRPSNTPGAGVGVGTRAEVGPPDDLLEIYAAHAQAANQDQSRGTLLWTHALAGGLDRPQLALFRQFRDQMKHDYPPQPPSQPKKP